MTIDNKSERNYRGKCLGWPVTSYGGAVLITKKAKIDTLFMIKLAEKPRLLGLHRLYSPHKEVPTSSRVPPPHTLHPEVGY